MSETIDLNLSYFCPDLNNHSSFQITTYVLEQTQIDLIVGRKVIRDVELFSIFPDQIKSSTSSTSVGSYTERSICYFLCVHVFKIAIT